MAQKNLKRTLKNDPVEIVEVGALFRYLQGK